MQQQQTTFAFEEQGFSAFTAPPLEAGQQQRLIELMAQAIQAVLQHAQEEEFHDRS